MMSTYGLSRCEKKRKWNGKKQRKGSGRRSKKTVSLLQFLLHAELVGVSTLLLAAVGGAGVETSIASEGEANKEKK